MTSPNPIPKIPSPTPYRRLVRALIVAHPTFFCPVSKECLDYRQAEIVKYKAGDHVKTDVVSHAGIEKLKTSGLWEKLEMKIDDEA